MFTINFVGFKNTRASVVFGVVFMAAALIAAALVSSRLLDTDDGAS